MAGPEDKKRPLPKSETTVTVDVPLGDPSEVPGASEYEQAPQTMPAPPTPPKSKAPIIEVDSPGRHDLPPPAPDIPLGDPSAFSDASDWEGLPRRSGRSWVQAPAPDMDLGTAPAGPKASDAPEPMPDTSVSVPPPPALPQEPAPAEKPADDTDQFAKEHERYRADQQALAFEARMKLLEDEVRRLRQARSPLAHTIPDVPPGPALDLGSLRESGAMQPGRTVQPLPQAQMLEQGPGPTPGGAGSIGEQMRAANIARLTREQNAENALQDQYGGVLGATVAGGQGLLRGATLGLSDPVLAGAEALGSIFTQESYSDAYARARRDMEKFRAANPWISGISEITGAVLPALYTAGGSAPVSAAGIVARATPAGRAALLGEELATTVAGGAAARGAGPVVAGMAGAAAGAGAEGAISGFLQSGSEATRPGLTPAQMAEEVGWGTATGLGVGTAVGLPFGLVGGYAAKGRSYLDEGKPRKLPDVERSDVPPAQVEQVAQGASANREAITDPIVYAQNDVRTPAQREVDQVAMSQGGFERMKTTQSREAQKEFRELFQLVDQHEQDVGIAGKRLANEFNEADAATTPEAAPTGVIPGMEGVAGVPQPGLEEAVQSGQVMGGALERMKKELELFQTPTVGGGQKPLTGAEQATLDKISILLAEQEAFISNDLTAGNVAEAWKRFDEGIHQPLAKRLAGSDNPRMRKLLKSLIGETDAALTQRMNSLEIPLRFTTSREVMKSIRNQFSQLHAQLDTYVNVVTRRALEKDAEGFRLTERLRQTFDRSEAHANQALAKGKVGEAFMVMDQGVKAFLGKSAQRAKDPELAELLREMAESVRHYLGGTEVGPDGKDVIVKSIWDQFVDARPAMLRVLNAADEIAETSGAYANSPIAKKMIDDALAPVREAMGDNAEGFGNLTAWDSAQELGKIERTIKEVVDTDALWQITSEDAIHTRRQLGSLLGDADAWRALSLSERQRLGNAAWSRRLGTQQDNYWSQFLSEGPERKVDRFNNLEQANSEALVSLYSNIGDPKAARDEQAYRLGLRDIGADAEARARAWGDQKAQDRAKKIVDLTQTLERRADLMGKSRADALAGDALLKGSPGVEGLKGMAAGAATLGAAAMGMGGGVTGGLLGASIGGGIGKSGPKLKRTLLLAVAEMRAANGEGINKEAGRLYRFAKKSMSAAEKAGTGVPRAVNATVRLVSPRLREERINEARALQDPSSEASQAQREKAAEIETVNPELAQQIVALEQRQAAAVNAVLPPEGTKMDPTTERKVARIVTAAYYPENTLKRIGEGIALPDEVKTLQTVYPDMFAQFTAEVQKLVDESGPPKHRAGELLLFRMAGIAVGNTHSPESIRRQQAAIRLGSEKSPLGSPPGGRFAGSRQPFASARKRARSAVLRARSASA